MCELVSLLTNQELAGEKGTNTRKLTEVIVNEIVLLKHTNISKQQSSTNRVLLQILIEENYENDDANNLCEAIIQYTTQSSCDLMDITSNVITNVLHSEGVFFHSYCCSQTNMTTS